MPTRKDISIEQKELKEFLSLILLLPKEERAILLANANAFRARLELKKTTEQPNGSSQ